VDGGLILNSLFRYSGNGVPDGAPFNGTFRESNEDRITGDRAVADSKGHTLIGGELGITRLAMAKPIVVGRDHVLYIAGTSGKDQMTVKTALDGNVSITINGSTSQVARSGLTGININGSEGNNQIISAVGLPTTILSGS